MGWQLTVHPDGTSQVKSPGGKVIRSHSPPPVPGNQPGQNNRHNFSIGRAACWGYGPRTISMRSPIRFGSNGSLVMSRW